jgi:hypothetical protein
VLNDDTTDATGHYEPRQDTDDPELVFNLLKWRNTIATPFRALHATPSHAQQHVSHVPQAVIGQNDTHRAPLGSASHRMMALMTRTTTPLMLLRTNHDTADAAAHEPRHR